MKRLYEILKRPNGAALAVVYPLTVIFIALSVVSAAYTPDGIWGILSYAAYGITAILLGYTVYTVVIYASGIKKGIVSLLRSKSFTRELLESFGFRTIVGGIASFVMSILYGVFNGVVGIINRSVWYGSLAAYYILLTFIRGGVLLRHRKSRDRDDHCLKRAKTYLNSGILLLILNMALSVAIAQMIFDGMGFSYGGIMIYVSALYAFIKIGMAIFNFVRAHRQNDILVESVRNISLVDGAVSILALQTAMLSTFSDGTLDHSLMNTLTGSAVSVMAYSVAIYTVIKGIKEIKRIKLENKDE